ncbi:MAG: hypothetical protein ABSC16_05640 [Candidatus Dormibacteria bacterium]|nr:hypothetical protein [Chloroflexota bacterium]
MAVAPRRAGDRRRRGGTEPRTAPTAALGMAGSPADPPWRRPYGVAVAWGILWRYAVLGAVVLAMVAGPHPPLAAPLAIVAGGVVLGLWFRRPWPAALWRAAVLGWVAAVTAGWIVFPIVLASALAVLTVEPWLLARGRGRSRDRQRLASAPALPSAAGMAPAAEWPRARRRR